MAELLSWVARLVAENVDSVHLAHDVLAEANLVLLLLLRVRVCARPEIVELPLLLGGDLKVK